ncbi:MAG: VOC family protein [Alphaproteobacteria bacterium]
MSTDRTIDYIEFNVADMARAKRFYGDAFGWTFTDYGPHYCEFSDGTMKGGFDASMPVTPGGPLVVLYADDLAQVRTAIVEAGGTISREMFSFPGGQRLHFKDPDGYELAVWNEAAAG